MTTSNIRPSLTAHHTMEVALDVQDLPASEMFWCERMGFRAIDRLDRGNLPCDWVRLVSDEFPGLVVCLSNCYPRPVMGSSPGSLRKLTLFTRNLAGAISRLGDSVRWSTESGEAPAPTGRVSFLDRNGYLIELAELPGGLQASSGYGDASP